MADASKKPVKAVIFAGGIGTRMWPLSRKKSPKQFEPIIDNKSTLQLSVDRLRPDFDWADIYISTGESYQDLIAKQLPDIPQENIIGEPEMRDVAPAVGYLMGIIAKKHPGSPAVILWSDHLVEHVEEFKKAIHAGADYVREHPDYFVFIGQRPRFANQNLGWIEYGDTIDHANGIQIKEFKSWHYRPELDTAKQYFRSHRHAWNPGYFVVMPEFALQQFQKHAPEMFVQLKRLRDSYGQPDHQQNLQNIYPQMARISFDDAVVTKTSPDKAVVLTVDLGWSDIGAWESLKEALQSYPNENITKGHVYLHKTSDSIVYNYTDQLVTTVEVDGVVVVVTKDAVLVTKQQSIPEIKKMLKRFQGTDLEKYT